MGPDAGTPAASGRWRRVGARAALGLSAGLFVAALVLPIESTGRVAGWDAVARLATLVTEPGVPFHHLAVASAILAAAAHQAAAGVVLALGWRLAARTLAVSLFLLAGVVAGYFARESRDPIGDTWLLARNGPGGVAWFLGHSALVWACFLWPQSRRAAGPDAEDEDG